MLQRNPIPEIIFIFLSSLEADQYTLKTTKGTEQLTIKDYNQLRPKFNLQTFNLAMKTELMKNASGTFKKPPELYEMS